MSERYRVHGKYYYREIVTKRGSITLDCEIEAESADEAIEEAIDEAMANQPMTGDDWEEYKNELKAEIIVLSPEEQEGAERVAHERMLAAIGAPSLFNINEYAGQKP